MSKLRVGIIGLGGIARSHCSAIAELDSVEVVAVADFFEEKQRQYMDQYNIAKGYSTHTELLEDPEVDSIYMYTDGGASRGIFIKTSEILNFVQRNNEFRKVTLHTVEVPGTKANTKDNIRLLKSLAEESGGTYQLYENKK